MIPKYVQKYFWGDNLTELNWEKHKDYITKTVLEKGDLVAVKWLLEKADNNYLKQIVKTKNLDPKSKNYWNIYLN